MEEDEEDEVVGVADEATAVFCRFAAGCSDSGSEPAVVGDVSGTVGSEGFWLTRFRLEAADDSAPLAALAVALATPNRSSSRRDT